jgi:predicted RND superfamily exporter protein
LKVVSSLIAPVAKRWFLVVLVVASLSIISALALSDLRIENDLMFMLPEHNPVKIYYQDMEERFGNSAGVAIAVSSPRSIYEYDLLKRIKTAGDLIRQANLRIPANRIAGLLGTDIDHALAIASFLQSRGPEGFTAQELGRDLKDEEALMQSLLDSFPFFLDDSKKDQICMEAARLLSRKAADPGLTERLLEKVFSPTDRRGRIRGLWVDDVISIAETDTVWPELEERSALHALFSSIGIEFTPELDAFLDQLIEMGFQRPEELVDILSHQNKELEDAGFSKKFKETLSASIGMREAGEILSALRSSPKQIRVGALINLQEENDARGLSLLKKRLRSWSLFEGTLLSDDEKSTLMLIRTSPNLDKENRALLLKEIRSVLKDVFQGSDLTFHMAGEPVIDEEVADLMTSDVSRLLPIVIILVGLFLVISFRSIAGVAYPLITVALSLLWCLGAMALFNVPISVVSTVLPVLMVAVGSAYGIHMVHETARQRAMGAERSDAALSALGSAGKGILLAGATTIAGFASLAFNPIVPLRDFGLFIAAGILFALLISFYLITALLMRFGGEGAGSNGQGLLDRVSAGILEIVVNASSRHPWIVLSACLLICAAGGAGIASLKVEVNNITFFKKDAPIRMADTFINDKFAGTVNLNVVLEGKDPYSVLDPAALPVLDAVSSRITASFPEVGKSVSVNDFIKKMNQAFFYNDPSFYRLPQEEDLHGEKGKDALVRQYASYLDKYSKEDTRPYIDEEKKSAVLQFQIKSASSSVVTGIMSDVAGILDGPVGEPLRQAGLSYRMTGVGGLYAEANDLIVFGQLRSVAFSLAVVLLVVSVVMRSFYTGLLSIAPLSVTILINFGLMGFLGVALDVGTAITACIAIGIGIDYSIHFLNRYMLLYSEGKSLELSLRETALSSGRAIFINALAVTVGFMVLVLSSFVPLISLGVLISITMITSAAGSVTLLPAALTIIERHKRRS